MTRSNVPPIDPVPASHCLKLRKMPIERIATHGLKQFGGGVHVADDTAGNITVQVGVMELAPFSQREKGWG